MIDHYADDAGYNMPFECTIVEAETLADAVMAFRRSMDGERFEICNVLESA